jgi:hypothetical protein
VLCKLVFASFVLVSRKEGEGRRKIEWLGSKTLILLIGKKIENRARTKKWKQKVILIHVVIKVLFVFSNSSLCVAKLTLKKS